MAMRYLDPARLPPGTRIGPWRVVDRRGRGAYGTVYLVEGVEPEARGRAALKLALRPEDARFEREEELLRRLRHPGVPRLLDAGRWQAQEGQWHPCVVMEWVEGLSLYAWARAAAPTSRQVLRMLAELARALEATHAAGGVHRDFKGDNVRVRLEDGRAFLLDFGSSHYQGAAPLTEELFPPGTPPYRSPEAWRYAMEQGRGKRIPYSPGPADDVFALGVTAYRLVTEEYPPSAHPEGAEAHLWHVEGRGPRPVRELNRRCHPALSALVSRMLSNRPEERGSAGELARALEQATRVGGPEADVPLFQGEVVPRPEAARDFAGAPAAGPEWRPWLAVASLAMALALVAGSLLVASPRAKTVGQGEERDAGTSAVGDSVQEAPLASIHTPSAGTAIAVDMPLNPLPGQSRPDDSGQCPRPNQVAIRGGCWWRLEVDLKDCQLDNYVYKGKCYEPAFPRPRSPTSSPAENPDGG